VAEDGILAARGAVYWWPALGRRAKNAPTSRQQLGDHRSRDNRAVNLSVAVRAGETYLHVESGLPVGTYPRLAIYSSDVIVPNIALDSPL
jgi:hypothetical protein